MLAVGFEPTLTEREIALKATALDHSATLARKCHRNEGYFTLLIVIETLGCLG